MKKFALTSLLLFIFGNLYANDDLKYLIKSYSLQKIHRIFQERHPGTESEAYALVRYHEEHPNGNRDKKFAYLVSLLKGKLCSHPEDKIFWRFSIPHCPRLRLLQNCLSGNSMRKVHAEKF